MRTKKMSLPFDTEVTRTQYQGWLLSLVKSVGLTGITVDASQPTSVSIERQKPKQSQSKRKVVIYRYGYSLRSRGSLQQLVTFPFQVLPKRTTSQDQIDFVKPFWRRNDD